ncbi:phospholipase D-like domain-containing protein [Halalkalicoccus subterraneus]|uniref:phospholipase D-like domain-containing protein n=1 Tax=Halalkalicoccus subterraneus TaxID=2675002 RepID=UPI000EFCEDB2|nr:phospholipase D family protein [Halalkalicoccus subterraneus]
MTTPDLSDGSPLCQDYTAAAVVQDTTRLQHLQAAFAAFDQEDVQITKPDLDTQLLDISEAVRPLKMAEFNAVMVSLANTHAATETRTASGGYSTYTFSVNPDDAIRVLDQQIVAVLAIQQLQPSTPSETDVKLVATLPRGVKDDISADVGRLDIALRRMLMDASDTVRIANPYFDPEQWIIEDLAALPRRGIETRILTREVTGVDADSRALDAVTAIVKALDSGEVENVAIRDFYETSNSGYQTGAVHAKIISVDGEKCYIGSANLTDLNLRGNFEFGVILEGEIVSEVTEVFDAIFSQSDSVPL